MTEFTGFPRGSFAFLAELQRRQDREWFRANKERYLELWQRPMEALMETLAARLGKAFPSVKEAPYKVFRIYNDTRFSPKKEPFKDHVAASLPIGFPPGHGGGLFIHLGLDEVMGAAGRWQMTPEELAAFREGVADKKSGAAFDRLVQAAVKKGYALHSFEQLKRVPAPYPKDHPRKELLTRKGLAIGFPAFKRSDAATAKFADLIVQRVTAIKPILRQLDQFLLKAR